MEKRIHLNDMKFTEYRADCEDIPWSTAVIFDMDGVLVDTNPVRLTSFSEFFRRNQNTDFPPVDAAHCKNLYPGNLEALVTDVKFGLRFCMGWEFYQANYADLVMPGVSGNENAQVAGSPATNRVCFPHIIHPKNDGENENCRVCRPYCKRK